MKFLGPTDILNTEERFDVLFMIGGANNVGPPVSRITTPRKCNEYVGSLEVLKQTSVTLTTNRLQLRARIANFPSLVVSKGHYVSRDINISNTRWYISIELEKYNRATGRYIEITPESPHQPETLAAYVYGDGRNSNEGSFDVKAKFMFTHLSTVKTKIVTGKFSFNSSNKYEDAKGVSKLALIEDILNTQNGYLIDNALEILVDVTINESETDE